MSRNPGYYHLKVKVSISVQEWIIARWSNKIGINGGWLFDTPFFDKDCIIEVNEVRILSPDEKIVPVNTSKGSQRTDKRF